MTAGDVQICVLLIGIFGALLTISSRLEKIHETLKRALSKQGEGS